jgi:VWFA-related protein
MLWWVLFPVLLPAQRPSRTSGEFKLVSEVRLVLLDAGVSDGEGEFVTGLMKEAFHVFDNGVERPITVFAGEDQPVTLGIVIDASGSMRARRAEVTQAAATLIAHSNPEDEVFLVFFGDTVQFGLPEEIPFSNDTDLLRRSLRAMPVGGRTALHDGILAALAHLDRGKHGRHALVVISDGGDNASRASEAELRERLVQSRATLYAVGIHDLAQRERAPGFLKKLAAVSGGLSRFPEVAAQLDTIARQIAADMRGRYVVGFPAAAVSRREERKVRLKVAGGGGKWKVRARQSYVAIPESAR